MSADHHLANLYLALFLKVGCVFVKKRFWMQLVVLLKTAAFCFMNFTWVATTWATLKIVCAALTWTLDRAKRDATRLGDVLLGPTFTTQCVHLVSNCRWSHDKTKLKLETITCAFHKPYF